MNFISQKIRWQGRVVSSSKSIYSSLRLSLYLKSTCCPCRENTAWFLMLSFLIAQTNKWWKEDMWFPCQWDFAGFSVFVVGVADVDYNELANIASKPSERHVFIVDDFESFEKIEDNLITFVCETATSSKSRSAQSHDLIWEMAAYRQLSILCGIKPGAEIDSGK